MDESEGQADTQRQNCYHMEHSCFTEREYTNLLDVVEALLVICVVSVILDGFTWKPSTERIAHVTYHQHWEWKPPFGEIIIMLSSLDTYITHNAPKTLLLTVWYRIQIVSVVQYEDVPMMEPLPSKPPPDCSPIISRGDG